MRVIIAGSRTFTDYDLLVSTCDRILANTEVTHIVSGGNGTKKDGIATQGADAMGEQYAAERGYLVKQFLPDWSNGPKGGPERNALMADNADALIAFHDGKSRGTADMIRRAKAAGLKVRVVAFV
ncbi:hypothetical protein LEM8419_03573 [Neolewinella maritima]|uniref:YspA cpYpsA-related SLOG domain-containing protein n=1 Tax=Neolewinella maritima TaxID=1383882 RepID=A0ABN8FAP4_9BACT|nr:DUF2493 domain-containing protein [Neolewinella maritima]CAH1002701.1 hypothetical protein LEM8419_03573 [Neolewinella maritima]